MFKRFPGFGMELVHRLRRGAGVFLIAGLSSGAFAQWPTSYSSAIVLGGGKNVWAGDILAMGNGGVICCYDSTEGNTRRLRLKRFGENVSQFTPDALYDRHLRAEKVKISFAPSSSGSYLYINSQFSRPDLQTVNVTNLFQFTDANGVFINGSEEQEVYILDGTISEAHTLDCLAVSPWLGFMGFFQDRSYVAGVTLGSGLEIKEPAFGSGAWDYTLASYTLAGPQSGTPTQVWVAGIDRSTSPTTKFIAPVRAEDQGEMRQFKSTLTAYSTGVMLTWLGEGESAPRLYTKLLSPAGAELSPVQASLENVADFTATSSTLGIPVFAAVLRNPAVYPPADLLAAGLINPVNGGTVTIPVAYAAGVKVKRLRQEPDGNFSLVYSIPENGTVALKVRRISGTTGATLWETVVADLGIAGEDVVEKYPNTFVAGDGHGALFIMTRYDQPGTSNSTFKLVRLLADGRIG